MSNIPSLDKDSFFQEIPVSCYRKDNNELVGEYKNMCAACAMHGIAATSSVGYSLIANNPRGNFSRKLKTKVYFKLTDKRPNNQDK